MRIDTGAGSSIDATLAIAPPRCYAVADALKARGRAPDTRLWGSSAQLYGLRAPSALASLSAGLGSYANTGTLARSLAQHGADALALSPVHAMFSADPHRYSPYSPSSRLFLNVMMIDPAALFGEHAARQAVADYGLTDIHARTEAATLIDWPVMLAAAGDARNITVEAISSASTARPSATFVRLRASTSSTLMPSACARRREFPRRRSPRTIHCLRSCATVYAVSMGPHVTAKKSGLHVCSAAKL